MPARPDFEHDAGSSDLQLVRGKSLLIKNHHRIIAATRQRKRGTCRPGCLGVHDLPPRTQYVLFTTWHANTNILFPSAVMKRHLLGHSLQRDTVRETDHGLCESKSPQDRFALNWYPSFPSSSANLRTGYHAVELNQ